jgi:hypothetical protein
LDLNKVWADFADNFNVPDVGVEIVNPTTLTQAIEYARPKTAAVLGYGAPLGLTAADDYYNYGQHPLEPRGYRATTPWHIRGLAVTPAGGGFSASWLAPADQSQGAVSGYVVEYAVNGGAFTVLTGWAEGDDNTDLTVTANVSAAVDDSIVIRVRARNANGNGPVKTAPAIIVENEGDVTITPTALRAVYTDGVGAASKTITTTTSATGGSPVLVVVSMRYSGTGGVLQDISATLDGVGMTSITQQNSANFQLCAFWANAADVPSGTWDVVLSNGTASFNGVAVGVYEMPGALDDQTGAVIGTASVSAST